MKRVKKAEDAYEFMGAIVVFTPKSYYYGNRKETMFNNGVVFAKIDIREVPYITKEKALSLYLFQIVGSNTGYIPLTTHYLEIYEESYLDIRFANLEEIKILRHLVNSNYIILNGLNKTYTLSMLNDILIYDPRFRLIELDLTQKTFDITLEWYADRKEEKIKILGEVFDQKLDILEYIRSV